MGGVVAGREKGERFSVRLKVGQASCLTLNEWRQLTAPFATCRFLRQIGNAAVHPDINSFIQLILGVRDEATKAESKLELA
jgi:hypothetical protein